MKNYNELTEDDGILLVKTARKVVTEYLKTQNKINLDDQFKKAFSENAGVFVTLNNQSGLRGCIGFPLPDKKLHQALPEAAIAAATEDPRFPAIKINELDEITFEVTILTAPQKIQIDDPENYPSQIKVGRDGLIIKSGLFSGLLLPQVPVEYHWDEIEFLNYTCEKAGIPKESWKKRDVEVLKFEGIVFKEEKPHGKIIREELNN